jgi:pimeloyl-ACP methyl ester carboxylesterase
MIELRGRPPVWVHEARGPADAPVLLLLHGLGASAALNWFTAFEALSAEFNVIAPDHRGHGRTPWGPEPFTLGGAADDAFAVADALGVDRFIPVGYSMGGPIAQLMWRRQPRRLDGLVLAATSRDFGGGMRDRIVFQSLPLALAASRLPGYRAFRARALSLLAPRFASATDRRWAIDELRLGEPRAILEAAAELGRFSSRAWISSVDVPTSVIVAMDDQLVPVRRQLKLARSIDHSVAAFVNSDHYAPGRPEADFVQVLLHECRGVARRSASRAPAPPAYWELLRSERPATG